MSSQIRKMYSNTHTECLDLIRELKLSLFQLETQVGYAYLETSYKEITTLIEDAIKLRNHLEEDMNYKTKDFTTSCFKD